MKSFKMPEKNWKEKQTKEWEEKIDQLTKEIKNIWNNLLNHETERQFNFIVNYGLRIDEFYIHKEKDYINRILYKIKMDNENYCNINYYPTEKTKMKINFLKISEEAEKALDSLEKVDFYPSLEKKYENVKTFYEFSKKLKDEIGDKIDNPVYNETETYEIDGENIIYKDLLFYTSNYIEDKWDEMLSYTDRHDILSFNDIMEGKLYTRFIDLLGEELIIGEYRLINIDNEDALVYKVINNKGENLLTLYYDKDIESGNSDGFLAFFKTDNPEIRMDLLVLTVKLCKDFIKKAEERGKREKEEIKLQRDNYEKDVKRLTILYTYEESTKKERTLEF